MTSSLVRSTANTIDFTKVPIQARAFHLFKRGMTLGFACGRGLGKSWFIRQMWFVLASIWEYRTRPGAPHPGIRQVLIMPTLQQARKIHLALLTEEVNGIWRAMGAKFNASSFRLTFPGGSWVQWVSAERAHLLRGLRCDVIWGDECDDLDPTNLEAVVNPWLSEVHSMRMQFWTGTPRRGRHGQLYRATREWPTLSYWSDQGFNEADAAKYSGMHRGLHATSYEAPLVVSTDYIDMIRGRTLPAVFKREYLVDFDGGEGFVFPMFDPKFHVQMPPQGVPCTEIMFGADHGFNDPGVIVMIGKFGKGADAVYWVLDEIYETEKTASWWNARVKQYVEWYPRALWFPDPSRPDIWRDWVALGARVYPKVDNAISGGLQSVADLLFVRERDVYDVEVNAGADGFVASRELIISGKQKFARLFVSPKCVNTIREFGKYRYKRVPGSEDSFLDIPEDTNNHAMDAVRYPLFNTTAPGRGTSRKGEHAQ